MAKYEITFVFGEKEKEAEKIVQGLFKTLKIKVAKADDWGVKELAYPIGREINGRYLYFEVEAGEKDLPQLEEKIKLEERIIRNLIIKTK